MKIKSLSSIATAALLAGCQSADRGTCLHSYQTGPRVSVIIIGKMVTPIITPAHEVCDHWQFPNGRAVA
jgi:hypothetical protein